MSAGPDIPLGQDGGGGPDIMGAMGGGDGGGGGPNYPGMSVSSDHPDMDSVPEEGKATIHYHKHSHTRERHPTKEGQHKHHVHLKVHSIRFHGGKKKVSPKQIAGALGEPGGDMSEEEPPE